MSILRDKDIYDLIQDNKLISSELPEKGLTFDDTNSAIQPSSLDLRVGDTYVPDENPVRRHVRPTSSNEHIVKPGETIVVTTQEELDLPKYIAAIGFPPSRMAVNGILMTNPGHIDPGYKGRMHLTMINMGRKDYVLRRGDPVVTLLLFRLNQEVEVDYQSRIDKAQMNTTWLGEGRRILEILRSLAPDFMDFKKRATGLAQAVAKAEIDKEKEALNKLAVLTTRIKAIGSLIAAIVTIVIIFGGMYAANRSSDIEARLKILEASPRFEERLDQLERRLLRIDHQEEDAETERGTK